MKFCKAASEPDAPVDLASYLKFVNDERNGFSEAVRRAASQLNLHDSSCLHAVAGRGKKLSLRFALPTGKDIQAFRLEYRGVFLSPKNKIVLQRLVTDARCIVLDHEFDVEFDVADPTWIHRFQLGIAGGLDAQLEIVFQKFSWQREKLSLFQLLERICELSN